MIINTKFFFPLALIISSVLITGCGGGGESDSEKPTPSTPLSNEPTPSTPPSNEIVSFKLSNINISDADALVDTQSSNTGKSIQKSAYSLAGTKKSSGSESSKASTDSLSTETQMMIDGVLTKIPFEFEVIGTTDCTAEAASLSVSDIFNLGANRTLLSISHPVKQFEDCTFEYGPYASYIVNKFGDVYPTEEIFSNTAKIIPANHPAWNTSDNPIIISQDNVAIEVIIDEGAGEPITLREITYGDTGNKYIGNMLFDGKHSATAATLGNDLGVRLIDVDSDGFKIIRQPEGWGNYYGMFIDHEGDFNWTFVGALYTINKETGELYQKWGGHTPATYGNRGRYKTFVMDDRCTVSDYTTTVGVLAADGAVWDEYDQGNTFTIYEASREVGNHGGNPDLSIIEGKYGYCVNGGKYSFVRYNFDTDEMVEFNTDTHGYEVVSYEFGTDKVLIEVIDSSTDDKHFIEYDFHTKAFTDHGVIEEGGRLVVKITPL